MTESLIVRLRKRAEIRRSIPRGEPDRISDILEEAATALEQKDARINQLEHGYDVLRTSINITLAR